MDAEPFGAAIKSIKAHQAKRMAERQEIAEWSVTAADPWVNAISELVEKSHSQLSQIEFFFGAVVTKQDSAFNTIISVSAYQGGNEAAYVISHPDMELSLTKNGQVFVEVAGGLANFPKQLPLEPSNLRASARMVLEDYVVGCVTALIDSGQ